MARQRREPSFQEVVDALKATPTASTAIPEAPGIYADGTVIAPDGRAYLKVASEVLGCRLRRGGAGARWSGTRAAAVASLSPGSTRRVSDGRVGPATIRRTKKA